MTKPESRRFGIPEGEPPRPLPVPPPRTPVPPKPPTAKISRPKTTKITPRTTRRATADNVGPEGAAPIHASSEARAQNQVILFGAIGGGVLLLVIIIAVAASGSSGGAAAQRPKKKPVVEAPPPPPKEAPKQYNYVRNTGSFFFVCSGTEKHQDKEVIISTCAKCTNKHSFAWDDGVSGWRCSVCKTVYDQAAIKCDECGRAPRVTHLKKAASSSRP